MNTFVVKGISVEMLEVAPTRLQQDTLTSLSSCCECKLLWGRSKLSKKFRSSPWTDPDAMVCELNKHRLYVYTVLSDRGQKWLPKITIIYSISSTATIP